MKNRIEIKFRMRRKAWRPLILGVWAYLQYDEKKVKEVVAKWQEVEEK